MHLSHMNIDGGNKATKFAVVVGIHLAVGALFVHSLNSRRFQMPAVARDLVVMFTPEPPPTPPLPQDPPMPMPATVPPQLLVPPIDVQVEQPPPAALVSAAVSADHAPQPPTATPQPEAAPRAATPPSSNTGVLRTAVLADAKACVTPAYPPRAARDGESGTVTLALLVGTDGRVAASRVQTSSGSRELDKAAIAALSTCQFKPAMNGGVAEQGWAQIAYVWTLEQ